MVRTVPNFWSWPLFKLQLITSFHHIINALFAEFILNNIEINKANIIYTKEGAHLQITLTLIIYHLL